MERASSKRRTMLEGAALNSTSAILVIEVAKFSAGLGNLDYALWLFNVSWCFGLLLFHCTCTNTVFFTRAVFVLTVRRFSCKRVLRHRF
jgi:hypothetical protein